MASYLETLLTDVFTATGQDPAKARRQASLALKTLEAVKAVTPQSVITAEEGYKIYRLRSIEQDERGAGFAVSAIAERFACSTSHVWRAYNKFLKRHRAALVVMREGEALVKAS